MGATIPAEGPGAQYAAELRILLVYLSESLGRLQGQNGEGQWGGTFFIGGGPLLPRRTAPGFNVISPTSSFPTPAPSILLFILKPPMKSCIKIS